MHNVVINLDRAQHRWQAFEAANRGLIAFERFPAIDGFTVSRQAFVDNGTFSADLDYTPGAMGCALSHISLWKRAVASNKALTIFEDDARCNKDFARLTADATAKLHGRFDLILWGWNFDSVLCFDLWGISSCAAIFNASEMLNTMERYRALAFQPTLYALQRAYGCPCYTISPRGAAFLLEKALPIRAMDVFFPGIGKNMPNIGIDVVLSNFYPQMMAFVSFPPLVLTKNEREHSATRES